MTAENIRVDKHLHLTPGQTHCLNMNYIDPSWCGHAWSAWVPFEHFTERRGILPVEQGVYRVRPVDGDCLMYIGQTGRSLRQRLSELSKYRKTPDLMPYNDPHTAAPSLWAWRDATGMDFECSGAPLLGADTRTREAVECFLLWHYRREYGSSTLCNFGRFHPHYLKSKDRSSGQRGGRLPEGRTNPGGGPSLPALSPGGSPCSPEWMGLDWTDAVPLRGGSEAPDRPGLYRILSMGECDVVYIGQSKGLRSRLQSHAKRDWGDIEAAYSYVMCPPEILPHQLKEWENDLIAGYYAEIGRPPVYQFTGR